MLRTGTRSFLILGTALLLGCGGAATDQTAQSEEPKPAEKPHWSYEGDTGPANWGSLEAEYSTCASGREQSPIDIADAQGGEGPKINFNYQAEPLKIRNSGHDIVVHLPNAGNIVVGDRTFTLVQLHFHSPSEHTLEGRQTAAEMHLVHQDGDDLAVVGVMLEIGGEANPAFEPIWKNLPTQVSEEPNAIQGVSINPLDLLPQTHGSYRYRGSLTTPPCSEGVSWFLLDTPVTLSSLQIETLRAVHQGNFRPVQPLNDRTLTKVEAP